MSEKHELYIPNHYGFTLRNDEKPFAHKLKPGGDWRDLLYEEQLIFWKGKIPKNGGNHGALRRKVWDEPASTITASPLQKFSGQLHPSDGYNDNHIENRGNYMEYNVTPTLPSNGLTVAELFCGGGLMAVGLKESGFSIVWANDFDKNAVKAYRHNFGDYVVHADITTINPADIPDVDVIAGGPPCQDYSVAGKGEGENGERGKLVFAYLDIIRAKMPKAFIFENVKGLVGKKHRHTFEKLIEEFNRIGYTVSWKVLNAWDYGVAQKRERVFIVGVRNDLGFSFVFPEPEPEDYRTQVLRDVIGDLPDPGVKLNGKQIAFLERNPVSVAKNRPVTMDEPSRTIPAVMHKGVPYGLFYPSNHTGFGLRKDEEPFAHKIPPGGNWKDLPPEEQKAFMGGAYESGGGKTGYLRRESWEEPAATVTANPMGKATCQLSPQAPRRFTVRECLRIQSAPDWYVLPDDISLSAQYRIVGNGVPCRVAWYLGRALAEQLKAKE